MIIKAIWTFIAFVANAILGGLAAIVGAPPSWWPQSGSNPFVQGVGYFVYFFNFPALITIVGFVLGFELVLLGVRWARRGLSLFTGGGGSI